MIKKSGIITICGRPNVGKSTLTNAFVGEKVAIVTNKPQTTRNRICGIKNRGESQFVFVDTPGLHKARTRLGDYMVNVVKESVADVDAVLLLVEPIPNVGEPEGQLIARIKALGCPAVLAINKADTVPQKDRLLEVIQVYSQEHDFDAVVPISAKTGQGVEELLDVLEGYLPKGPQLFPDDMTSDQPERQVMGELLREKLGCRAENYGERRFALEGGVLTEEAREALSVSLDHSIRLMGAAFELWDFGRWSPILRATIYEGLFRVGAAVLEGTFQADDAAFRIAGRNKEHL